jgi:hypothetical protein
MNDMSNKEVRVVLKERGQSTLEKMAAATAAHVLRDFCLSIAVFC